MADRDDGPLHRAEELVRKVLDRVGSSVDKKLAASGSATVGWLAGSVAASLESHLEKAVRPDARGVRRQAPDRFSVSLTYEQHEGLSEGDRKALAAELAATAYEYIANHRYETVAKVHVDVGCDLFASSPVVTASFSPAPGETAGAVHDVRPVSAAAVVSGGAGTVTLQLEGPGGKPVVRARLEPGGDPLTVGRASGNRLLVDDDSVSKFHATLRLGRDGVVVVSDLGSTNGTFLNDETVPISTGRPVDAGDTVTFGDVPFSVRRL